MDPSSPISVPDNRHERHHGHGDHEHGHHEHGHHEHGHHEHGHHEHGHHEHGHHEHGHHEHGHHEHGLLGRLKHALVPHSHDAADSVDSALKSSDRGIRAVKISLAGLGATAVLQLVIAWISGSVALLADTIHNFSDALTAVPLWIAFSLGRRAASRRYTYGFGRAEDLAGLFVIAMIALSAVIAAWEAIHRLINPAPLAHLGWVAVAGLVGFIGNEAVAQLRIREGKAIGSAALVADGYHARTDGFTSLAVLGGAAGVALGFPIADPIIGLIISGMILLVLRTAARDVFRRLMDGIDPRLVDQVEALLAGLPGVASVCRVRMRWIGHELHADVVVDVNPTITADEAHAVATNAQEVLLRDVPRLTTADVHPHTLTAHAT